MFKVVQRLGESLRITIRKKLRDRLEEVIKELKQVIIAEYDEELVDVVTDRKSKTNPNLYREEFIKRLDEFQYIKEVDGSLTINVPDMETFNFSGRLKTIEAIMSGTAGIYVEINEEDYVKAFNKKPVNEDPVDEYVAPKERIYLIRYDARTRAAERTLKKKLVRYPFSNTPPIEIFEAGEKFIDGHIDEWIDDSIDRAEKEFANKYKGVIR